ncbi:MAG: hypothetical protein MUC67_01320 [Acidobacteria bacterium]|jgi:hypothetical protein|nr:hypothetical protein [Acidobacteriota bacterium]
MAIVRFVLLTILVLIVLRWVRFALASASAPRRAAAHRSAQPAPALPERLVEDPVCGLRLPESRAVREGEQFYCSEECLRASRGG